MENKPNPFDIHIKNSNIEWVGLWELLNKYGYYLTDKEKKNY